MTLEAVADCYPRNEVELKLLEMKRLLISVLSVLLLVPAAAQNIAIKPEQLPSESLRIIAAAFPDDSIKSAKVERRASLVQYEVKLKGGIKMQFSKDGKFTECVCKDTEVPSVLIPEKIRNVIHAEFPNNEVREIEHDGKLYELLLDNGTSVSFNSAMRLVDIDYAE